MLSWIFYYNELKTKQQQNPRNLTFAQGGLNGFLQIPHEVSDSFHSFF